MSGLVVVLSGPGGVGKGVVAARLIAHDVRLRLGRSWTTRPQRAGESDDAYTFVDRDEFLAALEAGSFLEWNEFLDNYYATPLPELDADHDTLLEIDVNGAVQVADRLQDPLLVFLDAPSRDAQRDRLRARGDNERHVADRLAAADRERGMAERLGAVIVINDTVEQAVADIEALIARRRGLR